MSVDPAVGRSAGLRVVVLNGGSSSGRSALSAALVPVAQQRWREALAGFDMRRPQPKWWPTSLAE